MKISPTLKAKAIVEERKKKNLPIYDGGLGENHLPSPVELINVIKENAHLKQYTSIEGSDEFKKTISNYYKTMMFDSSKVLVGNGLKELIYLLISAWDKKIILITPCWVTYLEDVKILKKDYVLFETNVDDNYNINFDDIEETFKDNIGSLLFINNPNNPTGVVYSPSDIMKLAKLCKKYNITVFEDSIYYNMSMKNIKRISCYYDKCIIGSSLSKDWASGGWRFGWMVMSSILSDLHYKMKCIGSSMYSCPTQFMNNVGTKAIMLLDENPSYFYNMKLKYKIMHDNILKRLEKSGLKHSYPEGSWYVMLDFSNYKNVLIKNNIRNSDDLMFYLIERFGIVTVSGESFGINRLSLRVSLVQEKILDGIDIMIKWLKDL